MKMQRCLLILITFVMTPLANHAQTFDKLYQYGNAANAEDESGAGIPQGADFSDAASGNYTITAGGTDFWSATDHGSAIFDDDGIPETGDFSAWVKVQIGLEDEVMPGEWGRTGIMARSEPDHAGSAYFASVQKFDGGKEHVLQYRDMTGGNTSRVSDGRTTTLITGPAAAASGANPVPVWLGLHRFGTGIYATWAPDDDGSPGRWRTAEARSTGSAAHQGPVHLGLFHQNHDVQPEPSTAIFTDFSTSDFNNELGEFPAAVTANVSDLPGVIQAQIWAEEIGGGDRQAATWTVEKLGVESFASGLIATSILRGNNGQRFELSDFSAQGSGQIDSIAWAGNANPPPEDFEKYPDVFDLPADNDNDGDNQERYSVDARGQIFIPESGTYQFKDGVDDYALLEIDGEVLIDDNSWTSIDGTANGGSPIVFKDFDEPGWYDFTFQMAEGGGGDAGFLYWDYDEEEGVGENLDFPVFQDEPAGFEAVIPVVNFRSVQSEVIETLEGVSIVDGILMDAAGNTMTKEVGDRIRVTVNGKSRSVTIVGINVGIDELSAEVRAGTNDASFDLNGDNVVDQTDRTIWVEELNNTYFGDSNLDGEFDTADLVVVFQAGEYEDDIAGNSIWATGDWDGDGDFGTSDLVIAFQAGGFEQGPRVGVSAIPEPTSLFGLTLLLGYVSCRRRRR